MNNSKIDNLKEKLITVAIKTARAWDVDSPRKEDDLTDLLLAATDLSRALTDARVKQERRLRIVKPEAAE